MFLRNDVLAILQSDIAWLDSEQLCGEVGRIRIRSLRMSEYFPLICYVVGTERLERWCVPSGRRARKILRQLVHNGLVHIDQRHGSIVDFATRERSPSVSIYRGKSIEYAVRKTVNTGGPTDDLPPRAA